MVTGPGASPPRRTHYAVPTRAAKPTVLVCHPVSVVARGLLGVLEDQGIATAHGVDPEHWVRETFRPVVLTPPDRQVLERLRLRRGSLPVVAVVDPPDEAPAEAYASCLAAGYTGVVANDASGPVLVSVITAAIEGWTMLPSHLAQQIAQAAEIPVKRAGLLPESVAWLRWLADGGTIAELADRCGRSERDMYRALSRVYASLGARNRVEALLHASRLGLLAD